MKSTAVEAEVKKLSDDEKEPTIAASKPRVKDESPQPAQTEAVQTAKARGPKLKRESSSLFKAFAKSKPKLAREQTDSSAAASVRV